MKTTKILPTAFLVTALMGAGAVVATAQSNDAATEAPAATATEVAPEAAPEQGPAERDGRGFLARMRGGDDHRGEHGERRGGRDGHRAMHGGHGMRGGMMMQQILTEADTDGDGALTQAEIDAYRSAQVSAADASGDGNLEIEEFATLYNQFMRPHMVDAFQELDADGDGAITAEELNTRVDGLVDRLDRDGDGAISPADRRR